MIEEVAKDVCSIVGVDWERLADPVKEKLISLLLDNLGVINDR